ncbi:hypothetical protein [Natrinema hispanicum]|uniref:Uncharacterized protein n=1 Tax=Natrinema hispanicum TaxID=392421 RepID=A0A1I0CRG7_9EURY|nr:hypothetical protein [Natrinema hispanicum]SDC44256.1 hypothetical protein SAMN05192552_100432 [Natrinema hispanicum]SET21905.1 hypothetical protein SAMN04488694_104270 [Natrinema hispanicum]
MGQERPKEWFVTDTRANAVLTWALTGALSITVITHLFAGRFVGAAFAAVAVAVAVVPPLIARSWTHTLPWPLLTIASLPLALAPLQPTLRVQFVVGIGVAALGMLVVSALQLTTTLRMTPAFAVVFVVIATLAVAGFWAVGSAFAAAYLGGTFAETNDELMRTFSVALIAGLASGLVFWQYFRWQLRRTHATPPQEVEST